MQRNGWITGGLLLVSGLALAQEAPPPPPKSPEAPPAPRARIARISMQRGGSYLGIGAADVDEDRAKALNLGEEYGVEVKRVDEGSPAEKAGLKEGDVVIQYQGQRVEGTDQFVRMVRETPPGRAVKLQVLRKGVTQTLTATLGRREHKLALGDDADFEVRIPDMPKMPTFPDLPEIPTPNFSWQNSRLGIEGESVTSQLAAFFGVKEGVLVRGVVKGSAAEKAGLKAGDVVTKVDGEKVASAREISSLLRSRRSKRTLPLTVVRERKEMTITVTLPEGNNMGRMAAPVIRPVRKEEKETL